MQFWLLFGLCVFLLLMAVVQDYYVRQAARTIVLLQKEIEARKTAYEVLKEGAREAIDDLKKGAQDALRDQQANFVRQLLSLNGRHVSVLRDDEPVVYPHAVEGIPMTIRVVSSNPGNSLVFRYEESSEGGET